MNLRNIAMGLTLILGSFGLANGQCAGNYSECQPDGDETPCPNGMNNCCEIYNACNGPYSPIGAAWNYDPDFAGTGGCDLSCAPIDSWCSIPVCLAEDCFRWLLDQSTAQRNGSYPDPILKKFLLHW